MKVIIYGDTLFSLDMLWGFRQLGHDAQLIYPRSIQELEQIFTDTNPDLLMTLGSPAYFNKLILQHIGNRSSSNMKYIHWDTDGITWFEIEMNHIRLSKPDRVFTVCPEMLELLRKENIPSEMLFYAFSPVCHFPRGKIMEQTELITFLGGSYLEVVYKYPKHYRSVSMAALFKPLLYNNYPIDFYGDSRHKQLMKILFNYDVPNERVHGRCAYEKTYQIYSNSYINLVTQNHEHTITKRTFEILGSGGFILSYDNTAVREMFTDGTDLVLSSSPEHTLELVAYYKNNPDKYHEVRANALLAAQNHTYQQRVEYILSKLT